MVPVHFKLGHLKYSILLHPCKLGVLHYIGLPQGNLTQTLGI